MLKCVDQDPTDDAPAADPNESPLEPFDDQEIDDRFDRLERGDAGEEPAEEPAR